MEIIEDNNLINEVREGILNPKRKRQLKRVKAVKTERVSFKARLMTVMVLSIIGIVTITALGVKSLQGINNWWDGHYFAFDRLEVSLPRIRVEAREPQTLMVPVVTTSNINVSKTQLTEEEKVSVMKNSGYYKVLAGIRLLESSNNAIGDGTGHHVDCAKVGMSNEFGYDALDNFCFGSFEESVEIVSKWVEDNLDKMSLNSALCKYSTGRTEDVCEYAKNYHALDKAGKLASN